MKIKNYKDLGVWNNGIEIVDVIYDVREKFPKEEQYGLAAHLKKTAISIPSNIAEGFMRQHLKEYTQFLYISLGSCAELETQIIVASRRKFILNDIFSNIQRDIEEESKMIMGLIQSLKNRV